jgi:tRNA threonylcarbamoyladenosine biosynthesis protein TsaE
MVRTSRVSELQAYAAEIVASLTPHKRARIVALSGELGAGKTSFSQAVAAALGVVETVTSPTFVIQKSYELSGEKWERLIHIDAYRLKGAEELEKLGWDEIATNPENLILLEWPERVPELIGEDAIRIRFDIEGDGRIIHIYDGQKSGTEG